MSLLDIDKHYGRILDAGYKLVPFRDYRSERNGQVILRHDIDYDVQLALRCAELEKSKGVYATYFFLMRSDFYNPLGNRTYADICRIRDLGHEITVHFDPGIYSDDAMEDGLKWEVTLFERIFGTPVSIVSFHRPSERFLRWDGPLFGMKHTYMAEYFRDMPYYSDSMGIWRHGDPCDAAAFKDRTNIHMLMHPVWWFGSGDSNLDVIRELFRKQVSALKENWRNNSKLFDQLNDDLL